MLELQNLQWYYGSIHALKDLSFKAEKGEILGILGENGAGKSTLLRLLSGLHYPGEGQIIWNGLESTQKPEEYRSSMAFLPEGSPLPEKRLTGEFLQFHARLYSCPDELYRKSVKLTELKEVWDQPIGTLSRGYRQRIGLTRALLKQPDLLLLDEPFSGLDPRQILSLRSWLQESASARLTVFSSHILPEVYALCHRILVLQKGRLVGSYRKEDLSGAEELESLFRGEAPHAD